MGGDDRPANPLTARRQPTPVPWRAPPAAGGDTNKRSAPQPVGGIRGDGLQKESLVDTTLAIVIITIATLVALTIGARR